MKEFEFDDDFNVDSGIELGSLTDSEIDFGSEQNVDEKSNIKSGLGAEKKEGAKNVIKTSIIGLAVGLGVIVLGFLLIRLVTPNREKQNQPKAVDVKSTPAVVNTQPKESSDWVELKQDDSLSMDKEISSRFTITSIKHLAKKINENNTILVKSIVKGNISGLVGTYEVEMPYDKAKYLKVGAEFKITYTMMEKNEVKIIGEIRY